MTSKFVECENLLLVWNTPALLLALASVVDLVGKLISSLVFVMLVPCITYVYSQCRE